ncbi:hypothetical protein LUZ60_012425 [Juncus effusus]|nr:hypothetical protein LUZ60_012425 [Juncus effusus]
MIGSKVELNIFTILIGFFIALIVVLWSVKNEKRRAKLPPGGMGWPIVGSTFLIFKPHSPMVIGDFVRHQLSKHGNIFTTKFLGKTTVISTDPDLSRLVLQNQMRLVENSSPQHIKNLMGHYNLPFLSGDRYKNLKSMLLGFMNTWEIQTSFLEIVQNSADRVLNSWKHKDSLYLCQEAHKFVFSVIVGKTIGLKAEDSETEELRQEFITFTAGFHCFPINLPFTFYGKALRARERIVKNIKKMMETKKTAEKINTIPTDLLSWLLEKASDESINDIFSTVIGFSIAALFNTSVIIPLAIYFLRSCPKALEQLRREYLQIMREKKDDKHKLTWDDYKQMEFSQCVINETLRLGNLFPGHFKKAIQDIEFKGYLFPKGTVIVPYSEAMHLDPIVFERPEDFDPWRWQSIKKTNYWTPFGGGLRLCSGSEFAKIQIAIFLHRFCLNYNWEPAEPDHPMGYPVVFPKEFPVKISPTNRDI